MSFKTNFFIFSFMIVCLMFIQTVSANEYTVRDIAVDITGETLIEAKGKALEQARRNGFTVLMRRLGALSAESKIDIPDDATIASFVSNFEVNREKASKNRYLASVNVTFNERSTDAYIARHSRSVIDEPAVDMTANADVNDNQTAQTFDAPQDGSDDVQSDEVYDINKYRQSKIGNTQSSEHFEPSKPIVTGKITTYNTLIPVKSLGDWVRVQKVLYGIPSIRNLAIQTMNSNQVLVNLTHQGSPSELLSILKSNGLMLYSIPQPKAGQAPYVLVIKG